MTTNNTKFSPEMQTKIDKSRAEIKERSKDPQWIAICTATKDLVAGDHKIAAKNLIQTYLKARQK